MKILFTALPASGHLHPLVPLALAARQAGHEVRFALGPAVCAGIQRLGFTVIPAGTDLEDPEVERVGEAALADPGKAVSLVMAGIVAQRLLPDLQTLIERWRPDIMISDIAEFASWVVAEQHGIPRAVVPFGVYIGPDMLASIGAGPALEALRRRAGLDPEPWLETLRVQPCLLFAPPGYQLPGVTLPAHVHLFRPIVFDQSGEETLPEWVRDLPDRPLVYATLGTAFNRTAGVLEATIDAARDQDFDLVVTVGRNRDPASLGALPANVRVERYIPQSLLLPHCDAVVSHAGYSTVMATMCSGLPMVLTPIGADQPVHADRCRELGVAAIVEPSEHSAPRVREAIRRVLEDLSYRQAAEKLRDEITHQPGIDQAVRVLEALCHSNRETAP
jgi:MGT family glycosyltransferase